MTIAAVCPVHGPFESRAFAIENSAHVTLSGNQESCPTCGLASRIMEGTFSFPERSTVVHDAPEWSIRALSSVNRAISDAVRIAADPNAPIEDVRNAFDKAASLTRINSQDAPPGLRSQIMELLSLKPVLKVKGYKRKILLIGVLLHFVLSNYGAYKGSIVEITNDLRPVVEQTLTSIDNISNDTKNAIEKILDELERS